jgi:flavin-dependent dehydrogenase
MPKHEDYDVVIVGGGPAGSSCAIRLARAGHKVLLVEQKRFPRPKLCGEFISPECLSHFADLGVLDAMSLAGGVNIERTVFYARSGRSISVPSHWLSGDTKALGLSRAQMDNALLEGAASAVSDVWQETTVTGLQNDDGVNLVHLRDMSGRRMSVKSRLVLDATGRSRVLSKLVGGNNKKRADFVAFKTHLTGASVPATDCEIYGYRGGYGGCSGVENGLHNLCFIIRSSAARDYRGKAEQVMKEILFTNKKAESSLADAKVVDQWLAVPIESYGRSDLSPAPGVLAIGDAAGFIDPFTGSGMLLALESSKIAADVITKGPKHFNDLSSEYDRRYRGAFDRRLMLGSLIRRAAYSPLAAEILVTCLGISGRLTRQVAKATRTSKSLAWPDQLGDDV